MGKETKIMKECPICGRRIYRQQKPILNNGMWIHKSCINKKPIEKWVKRVSEKE